MMLRLYASGVECDGLTTVEVRDFFQDVTGGVKCLWSTDPTGGIPMRVQDDLDVGEVPRGDSLV